MAAEKEIKQHSSIIVCGSSGSGKTSLIQDLLYNISPKPPLATTTLETFDQSFSLGSNNLGQPATTVRVACSELSDTYLKDSRFNFIGQNFITNADTILIVVDGTNLLSAQELKKYFDMAMINENVPIHLVVNKTEKLNKAALKNSITKLLNEAEIEEADINIHYVSTKDNQNIQQLRDAIDIPEPSFHQTATESLSDQLIYPPSTAKIIDTLFEPDNPAPTPTQSSAPTIAPKISQFSSPLHSSPQAQAKTTPEPSATSTPSSTPSLKQSSNEDK